MRREWLLLVASVGASAALGAGLLRWWAPQLFGVPPDLRIVHASEQVVPFYENVFRAEHAGDAPALLNDPYVGVRARPLRDTLARGMPGPTDLLGFRNRAVPNRAEVVAIGDSQTWGINATLEQTWPSRLEAALAASGARVYSMAVGGWGAAQYLDMFEKSLAFRPQVAVVAFYSGNDPQESFRMAYAVERWHGLRPDVSLGLDDRSPQRGRDHRWVAPLFGRRFAFEPDKRLLSNERNPVVDAGWEIMADVARRIADESRESGVHAVFALIPTKELCFRARVEAERVAPDPLYAELVAEEFRRIEAFAARLRELEGATYVDLLGPLSRSNLEGRPTHPRSTDGHPNRIGYAVIAAALAPAVGERLGAQRE